MNKKIFLAVLLGLFVLIAGCYSCKTWQHLHGREPADKSVEFMWQKGCKPAPMPLPPQCEPPKKLVAPPPAPVVPNCAERIYPCGACGNVKLEKCMPPQVQTGAEFNYTIKVTNLTDTTIADVVVTDTIVSNFQYKSANPQPNVEGNKLVWIFPSIGPKESREINCVGIATASGIVQNCVDLTYRIPLCVQ